MQSKYITDQKTGSVLLSSSYSIMATLRSTPMSITTGDKLTNKHARTYTHTCTHTHMHIFLAIRNYTLWIL